MHWLCQMGKTHNYLIYINIYFFMMFFFAVTCKERNVGVQVFS
ncbi:hypothetical protein C4J96_0691 [Pseudomonas orientalis]|nr:hypothetical protein C4J96_0691 [Pseudomonas orientalis]